MTGLLSSLAYEGEPEARIERADRFGYWVDVTWGMIGLSTCPWWRPTRSMAEAKARRAMARWKAEESRESWTVRA
jgi:hypothetical protein